MFCVNFSCRGEGCGSGGWWVHGCFVSSLMLYDIAPCIVYTISHAVSYIFVRYTKPPSLSYTRDRRQYRIHETAGSIVYPRPLAVSYNRDLKQYRITDTVDAVGYPIARSVSVIRYLMRYRLYKTAFRFVYTKAKMVSDIRNRHRSRVYDNAFCIGWHLNELICLH